MKFFFASAVIFFLSLNSFAQNASDFGYDSIRLYGAANRGERPLVVVINSFAGKPAINHTNEEYDALIFGPSFPNVRDYYREVSNGLFTFRRAGIFRSSFADTGSLEKNLAEAKKEAGRQGLNFAQFDTNRDRKLTTDELTFLVVDNASQDLAATRPTDPDCVDVGNGYQACGRAAAVGHLTSFMTATHELCHTLGIGWDSYGGPNNNNNFKATLMGATIGVQDGRESFHLDGYHKMLLGWVRPRIKAMGANLNTAYVLRAPQMQWDQTGDEAPVVVYDPALGTRDFLLFEYRNPAAGVNHYDQNVFDSGLVAWALKVNGSFAPERIQSLSGPGMMDNAIYYLGGVYTQYGTGAFIKSVDGGLHLKFLRANTNIRERAKVGPMAFNSPTLPLTFERPRWSEVSPNRVGMSTNPLCYVESNVSDAIFTVTNGKTWVNRANGFGYVPEGWRTIIDDTQGLASAVKNIDGRLEVFARGADNSLRHAWENTPGGTWSQGNLGGILGSDPVARIRPDGRVEVYYVGSDRQLWVRPQSAPAVWQNQIALGGNVLNGTRPAVGTFQRNGSELFWVDARTSTLFSNRKDESGNWSGPAQIPLMNRVNGSPVVANSADGRSEVFIKSENNQIVHNWKEWVDGNWSATGDNLGGVTLKDPAVFANLDGKLDLAIVTQDGKLHHRWQTFATPAWSNWENLGGERLQNSPSAAYLKVFNIKTPMLLVLEGDNTIRMTTLLN